VFKQMGQMGQKKLKYLWDLFVDFDKWFDTIWSIKYHIHWRTLILHPYQT
jgi:hypothetical protein